MNRAALSGADLEPYPGYYLYGADDPFSIVIDAGQLFLARPYGPREALVYVGKSDFVDREDGAHLVFDSAGVTRTLGKDAKRYERKKEVQEPLSLLSGGGRANVARDLYRHIVRGKSE